MNGLDNVLVSYRGYLGRAARLYANSNDLKNPHLSAIYGDFHGFPPTVVTSGTRDLLLSLSVLTHRKLHRSQRNVNSRFALETAELMRARKGDDEAGAFCHDVSRAFFTEHADISKPEVIVPIAECFDISASDVETARHERRFSPTVDAFIEEGHKTGVRGVPAGVAQSAGNRRIDTASRTRAPTSETKNLTNGHTSDPLISF